MILYAFILGIWGIILNLIDDYKEFRTLPQEKRHATYGTWIVMAIIIALLCWFGSTFHTNSVTGDWYYEDGSPVF